MEKSVSSYGIALYSLALDKNKVVEYEEEMKKWEEIFHENEEFLHVLNSAFLSKKERKEILTKTCLGMNEDILYFFYVIIDDNVINYLFDIIEAFISACNEYQGIKEGIIYSTEHLPKEKIRQIEQKLSKIENQTIYLRNIIDKALIGGVKVVIGGHIYDSSLKRRIEEVKKQLLNNKEATKDED